VVHDIPGAADSPKRPRRSKLPARAQRQGIREPGTDLARFRLLSGIERIPEPGTGFAILDASLNGRAIPTRNEPEN